MFIVLINPKEKTEISFEIAFEDIMKWYEILQEALDYNTQDEKFALTVLKLVDLYPEKKSDLEIWISQLKQIEGEFILEDWISEWYFNNFSVRYKILEFKGEDLSWH